MSASILVPPTSIPIRFSVMSRPGSQPKAVAAQIHEWDSAVARYHAISPQLLRSIEALVGDLDERSLARQRCAFRRSTTDTDRDRDVAPLEARGRRCHGDT